MLHVELPDYVSSKQNEDLSIACHMEFGQSYQSNPSLLCYNIVVTWARVVCLIYTPEAQGPQAQGLRVYISGKPQVPMLQLLCNT